MKAQTNVSSRKNRLFISIIFVNRSANRVFNRLEHIITSPKLGVGICTQWCTAPLCSAVQLVIKWDKRLDFLGNTSHLRDRGLLVLSMVVLVVLSRILEIDQSEVVGEDEKSPIVAQRLAFPRIMTMYV